MDSVQVGKAVFGKEVHTTLGIEPRTPTDGAGLGELTLYCVGAPQGKTVFRA